MCNTALKHRLGQIAVGNYGFISLARFALSYAISALKLLFICRRADLIGFRRNPLSHLLGELFAAENVEMKVLYRLAAVLTDVGDDSVAVGKSELARNLRNHRENVTDG